MAGTPTRFSPEGDIDAFLEKATRTARPGGGGRLIFALDATASREPTWDLHHLQAEMFQTAAALGGWRSSCLIAASGNQGKRLGPQCQ